MTRYSSMSRRGLYRSRHGVILGVCGGFADYFDFSVFWVRAIVVILLIVTGLWPVTGLYILAALLMKSPPATHIGAGNDLAGRMKRKWKQMERRIRRMEDKATSREYDWNNRFHGYE